MEKKKINRVRTSRSKACSQLEELAQAVRQAPHSAVLSSLAAYPGSVSGMSRSSHRRKIRELCTNAENLQGSLRMLRDDTQETIKLGSPAIGGPGCRLLRSHPSTQCHLLALPVICPRPELQKIQRPPENFARAASKR